MDAKTLPLAEGRAVRKIGLASCGAHPTAFQG